jgi:hypothetical protein
MSAVRNGLACPLVAYRQHPAGRAGRGLARSATLTPAGKVSGKEAQPRRGRQDGGGTKDPAPFRTAVFPPCGDFADGRGEVGRELAPNFLPISSTRERGAGALWEWREGISSISSIISPVPRVLPLCCFTPSIVLLLLVVEENVLEARTATCRHGRRQTARPASPNRLCEVQAPEDKREGISNPFKSAGVLPCYRCRCLHRVSITNRQSSIRNTQGKALMLRYSR